MTTTKETYKQVANHCSEYTPKSSTTNCSGDCDCERTCLTCDHFTSSNLCDLNICNKIIRDHNLQ